VREALHRSVKAGNDVDALRLEALETFSFRNLVSDGLAITLDMTRFFSVSRRINTPDEVQPANESAAAQYKWTVEQIEKAGIPINRIPSIEKVMAEYPDDLQQ
jgi:hypothetical protein